MAVNVTPAIPESGEGPGTEPYIGAEGGLGRGGDRRPGPRMVIGWTRSAEEILDVGPRGRRRLRRPSARRARRPRRVAAIMERCREGQPWSGVVALASRRPSCRSESAGFRVLPGRRRQVFFYSARERVTRWAMGQSVLDGFLTRSPVGMAIVDIDLRCTWVNNTLESIGGIPREQRLGRRLTDLLPGPPCGDPRGRDAQGTADRRAGQATSSTWAGAGPTRIGSTPTPRRSSPWWTSRAPSRTSATWCSTSPTGGTPAN